MLLEAELCVLAAVQMHEAPKQEWLPEWDVEEEEDPDVRLTAYAREHHLMDDMAEYFDDDHAIY